jgi:hypothetical protein
MECLQPSGCSGGLPLPQFGEIWICNSKMFRLGIVRRLPVSNQEDLHHAFIYKGA